SSSPTAAIVEEFDSLVGEIIKQKEEVKKISDPVARRRVCFTSNLKNCRIIHQGRVIHSPQIASVGAISHIFPSNNLEDSFKMGDEDLNFIPNKELDKEDLIPIPREDDFQSFKTFSNPLFEKKDDFPSRNDESILKEEVHKTLFEDDEEIISIEVSRQISPKVNSEPSIESPISSSPSLSSSEASEYSLDEFADELALIDFSSYPERDDMTPDDVIREIEFLFYGDPTSDPTESKVEEFINENTPDMSKEFVLDDMSFSPKELNLESLPKDDFDNDDDLFEMDSNNDEWKRILYGEDFERMDSDSDKTKDFDKSSSSVFKSLSDEFEPGGSSYVEGNDLDFHVGDVLFSTINEDKVFKPGILDVFYPLHPPLMDFHVTKAFSGFTFSSLEIFSKKFFEPGINNAT
ncbi:hypothetical protein Tco_1480797, partial [Tanacetum coccineum]